MGRDEQSSFNSVGVLERRISDQFQTSSVGTQIKVFGIGGPAQNRAWLLDNLVVGFQRGDDVVPGAVNAESAVLFSTTQNQRSPSPTEAGSQLLAAVNAILKWTNIPLSGPLLVNPDEHLYLYLSLSNAAPHLAFFQYTLSLRDVGYDPQNGRIFV